MTEKPILSLYSNFLSSSYNILATALGQQLHIQQQHLHSGNATNVKFICLSGALASEWASFINAPHEMENRTFVDVDASASGTPQSPTRNSPRSPVRFTPVSQFSPSAATVGDSFTGKPLLTPLTPPITSLVDESGVARIATPPQGLLSPHHLGSPRRRSQSTQESSRSGVRAHNGNNELAAYPVINSGSSRPAAPHDLLKASLMRQNNNDPDRDTNNANRSTHSQSEDVTMSSKSHPPSGREYSVSVDVNENRAQYGSLTQANLQRMNISDQDDSFGNESRITSSRAPSLVDQWTDDISKIRAEIAGTEAQYRQEEAAICAAEEASLKDSVNTVYSSLLHQGLLPSELTAEQAKVQVWEGVQRKKNGRKSDQRLSIIAEELSSMRTEGEELIRRLYADIEMEKARELSNQQEQLEKYSKIVEHNTAAIVANKLRVQEESDRLRAEMSAAEKRVKDEALRRNQEEESKLQQTVSSVYASLLCNQELSSADLLLEQDKVHVWENLQRTKLAKSVKARRKATGKEVNRVLDLGRESIKQLMLTAEEQNKQMLLEIQQAEKQQQKQQIGTTDAESVDDTIKHRTYSDLPSVDGRHLVRPISGAESASNTVHIPVVVMSNHSSTNTEEAMRQGEVQQRDELIEKLRVAITVVQNETITEEQRRVQEENALCVEETSGLTASVGAVYASLLNQGLSAEQLLNEQEKVAVWEAIQRRKLQKQTARRKTALKTSLQDLRQTGLDKVLALNLELDSLLNSQSTAGSALTVAALDSVVDMAPFSEDSPLQRRMKDYSRAQFELHSSAQRELHDKQLALQQQIAERKAVILLEEQQRVDALQVEAERKVRVEAERIEAERFLAEQQREELERSLMEVIDEEDQHRTRIERVMCQEALRLRQARAAGLARKVCHRMATRIQLCCRNYRTRVELHIQATRIQRHVRGYLVIRRIARHFRQAISQIEDQSARVIIAAIRGYVKRRRAKFNGYEILHELMVVSILRFNLQRREILLLSCRIASNRRKKALLAISRQKRAEQRKDRERVSDDQQAVY